MGKPSKTKKYKDIIELIKNFLYRGKDNGMEGFIVIRATGEK